MALYSQKSEEQPKTWRDIVFGGYQQPSLPLPPSTEYAAKTAESANDPSTFRNVKIIQNSGELDPVMWGEYDQNRLGDLTDKSRNLKGKR